MNTSNPKCDVPCTHEVHGSDTSHPTGHVYLSVSHNWREDGSVEFDVRASDGAVLTGRVISPRREHGRSPTFNITINAPCRDTAEIEKAVVAAIRRSQCSGEGYAAWLERHA